LYEVLQYVTGCGLDDQTSIPGYIQSHSRAAPSAGEAPSEGLNEVRLLSYLKNQIFMQLAKIKRKILMHLRTLQFS
jgi:hypothetical protein